MALFHSIMKCLLMVTIKKTFVFNSSKCIHVIQNIIIASISESASGHGRKDEIVVRPQLTHHTSRHGNTAAQ